MQAPLGGVAAHDDAVRARVQPDVLHPDVVLVGEEVRQRVERLATVRASSAPPPGPARARWPSARRARGGRSGRWSALATSPAANTSGALVRRRSSTRMPSSTSSPAASARAVSGATPTPSTTASHATARAVGEADRLGAAGALDALHARAREQVRRPRRGARRAKNPPSSAPSTPSSGVARVLDQRHVEPLSPAPPPPPRSRSSPRRSPPARRPSRAASRSASESASVRRTCTPSRSAPGDRRALRHGARRDQQPVVGERAAVAEVDAAPAGVDRVDRHALLALDDVLLVEARVDARGRPRAGCRRAGSPSTAAGARTAPRAPRRSARCARRSPPRAASRRPWRRPCPRRR